jgi:uncharacterized protein (TIGR02117 family)
MTRRALLLVALLGVMLAGCATPPPPAELTAGPKTETIYLIERGWHTDIGIDADQLTPDLAGLHTAFPGATVLVIGFGARAYLLHGQHDLGDMAAALVPNPGALLVTGLDAPPPAAFPAYPVVTLHVSPRGLARLNRFLADSFDHTGSTLRQISPGPYPGSAFYGATETYSGVFTCNTWSAEGLQTAGLPVHADGVLFAGDVTDQARRSAAGR